VLMQGKCCYCCILCVAARVAHFSHSFLSNWKTLASTCGSNPGAAMLHVATRAHAHQIRGQLQRQANGAASCPTLALG
jgi:hypothetical protein